MAGLHKQSKRKKAQRAVDMSPPADDTGPLWQRPNSDECEEAGPWTFAPSGADLRAHRIKVRTVHHAISGDLVEFAIVQQAFVRGRWLDVVEVDSVHDDDVHLHRYGRKSRSRLGDPEPLMPLTCLADVQTGYDIAYERVVDRWAENYQRWHDG